MESRTGQSGHLSCGVCKQGFNSLRHLSNHQCNREKQLTCPNCEKHFESEATLNSHACPNSQLFCSICEERFSREHELLAHQKLHSKMQIYFCAKCEETYDDEESYVDHKRDGCFFNNSGQKSRVIEYSPCSNEDDAVQATDSHITDDITTQGPDINMSNAPNINITIDAPSINVKSNMTKPSCNITDNLTTDDQNDNITENLTNETPDRNITKNNATIGIVPGEMENGYDDMEIDAPTGSIIENIATDAADSNITESNAISGIIAACVPKRTITEDNAYTQNYEEIKEVPNDKGLDSAEDSGYSNSEGQHTWTYDNIQHAAGNKASSAANSNVTENITKYADMTTYAPSNTISGNSTTYGNSTSTLPENTIRNIPENTTNYEDKSSYAPRNVVPNTTAYISKSITTYADMTTCVNSNLTENNTTNTTNSIVPKANTTNFTSSSSIIRKNITTYANMTTYTPSNTVLENNTTFATNNATYAPTSTISENNTVTYASNSTIPDNNTTYTDMTTYAQNNTISALSKIVPEGNETYANIATYTPTTSARENNKTYANMTTYDPSSNVTLNVTDPALNIEKIKKEPLDYEAAESLGQDFVGKVKTEVLEPAELHRLVSFAEQIYNDTLKDKTSYQPVNQIIHPVTEFSSPDPMSYTELQTVDPVRIDLGLQNIVNTYSHEDPHDTMFQNVHLGTEEETGQQLNEPGNNFEDQYIEEETSRSTEKLFSQVNKTGSAVTRNKVTYQKVRLNSRNRLIVSNKRNTGKRNVGNILINTTIANDEKIFQHTRINLVKVTVPQHNAAKIKGNGKVYAKSRVNSTSKERLMSHNVMIKEKQPNVITGMIVNPTKSTFFENGLFKNMKQNAGTVGNNEEVPDTIMNTKNTINNVTVTKNETKQTGLQHNILTKQFSGTTPNSGSRINNSTAREMMTFKKYEADPGSLLNLVNIQKQVSGTLNAKGTGNNATVAKDGMVLKKLIIDPMKIAGSQSNTLNKKSPGTTTNSPNRVNNNSLNRQGMMFKKIGVDPGKNVTPHLQNVLNQATKPVINAESTKNNLINRRVIDPRKITGSQLNITNKQSTGIVHSGDGANNCLLRKGMMIKKIGNDPGSKVQNVLNNIQSTKIAPKPQPNTLKQSTDTNTSNNRDGMFRKSDLDSGNILKKQAEKGTNETRVFKDGMVFKKIIMDPHKQPGQQFQTSNMQNQGTVPNAISTSSDTILLQGGSGVTTKKIIISPVKRLVPPLSLLNKQGTGAVINPRNTNDTIVLQDGSTLKKINLNPVKTTEPQFKVLNNQNQGAFINVTNIADDTIILQDGTKLKKIDPRSNPQRQNAVTQCANSQKQFIGTNVNAGNRSHNATVMKDGKVLAKISINPNKPVIPQFLADKSQKLISGSINVGDKVGTAQVKTNQKNYLMNQKKLVKTNKDILQNAVPNKGCQMQNSLNNIRQVQPSMNKQAGINAGQQFQNTGQQFQNTAQHFQNTAQQFQNTAQQFQNTGQQTWPQPQNPNLYTQQYTGGINNAFNNNGTMLQNQCMNPGQQFQNQMYSQPFNAPVINAGNMVNPTFTNDGMMLQNTWNTGPQLQNQMHYIQQPNGVMIPAGNAINNPGMFQNAWINPGQQFQNQMNYIQQSNGTIVPASNPMFQNTGQQLQNPINFMQQGTLMTRNAINNPQMFQNTWINPGQQLQNQVNYIQQGNGQVIHAGMTYQNVMNTGKPGLQLQNTGSGPQLNALTHTGHQPIPFDGVQVKIEPPDPEVKKCDPVNSEVKDALKKQNPEKPKEPCEDPGQKAPLFCKECNQYFCSDDIFEVHNRFHNNVQLCTCEICSKSCSDNEESDIPTDKKTDEEKTKTETKNPVKKKPINRYSKKLKYQTEEAETDLIPETAESKAKRTKLNMRLDLDDEIEVDPYEQEMAEMAEMVDEPDFGEETKYETIEIEENSDVTPTSPIVCAVCNITFENTKDHGEHLPTCGRSKKHECKVCFQLFATVAALRKHKEIHGKVFGICKDCGRSFTSMVGLYRHQKQTCIKIEKKLSCEKCQKVFALKETLIHHQKYYCYDRTGETPFSCDLCNKHYPHQYLLDYHVKSHRTCKICNKIVGKNHLIRHMQIHSKIRPYKCSFCTKTYARRNRLVIHERMHTQEREQFKCECGKCFYIKANLERHKRNICNENMFKKKPFLCDVCKKRYRDKESITRHITNHHIKELYCDVCNAKFGSNIILKHHMEYHRKDIYRCDYCHKEYSRMYDLNRHEKTHITGDSNYSCPKCNMKFLHVSTYKFHLESKHTRCCFKKRKPKIFSCDVCDKKFLQGNKLNRHKKFVCSKQSIKTRPFVCDNCKKRFPNKTVLSKHIRKNHSKLYICDYCNASFGQILYIERHIKMSHLVTSYSCEICLQKFKKVAGLHDHEACHVALEFPCVKCDKKFVHEVSLVYHRKYRCGKAPVVKKVSQSSSSKCRKSKNDEESDKVYSCEICEHKFDDKLLLTYHKRYHCLKKEPEKV